MRVNADRASCSLYSCRGEGWKLPFRSTRRGPERPPGPVAVRMISDVVSKKFMKTVLSTLSTQMSGCQDPGVPSVVKASMQIAPPAVTWPVYQQKRGETHLKKKGRVG